MDQDNQRLQVKLLLAKEVALLLRTGISTIYLWAAQNRIPHLRINGLLRFPATEVAAWIGEHRHKAVILPQAPVSFKPSKTMSGATLYRTGRRVVARARRRAPQKKDDIDGSV